MVNDGFVWLDTPLIPFNIYSICKGMREVVLSNLDMWCRAEDVVNIALVQDVCMVQYGYNILRGVNDVHKLFILYSNCHYSNANKHT